jgi:HSP20 family molecular chaperone IbpA
MSSIVRTSTSPISEILEWLDLNRPTSLSDLTHYIPVESFVEENRYVVRADLPGVDPDKDIEVTVDGDVLTIHGERHEEERKNGHSEVRYGSFTRSVRLPKGASATDVVARYDAGVLEVTVPLRETPSDAITVAVQRGPEAGS